MNGRGIKASTFIGIALGCCCGLPMGPACMAECGLCGAAVGAVAGVFLEGLGHLFRS